uniref:zinc finger domain-containing protein n=1 Tax=uncultured Oxalicibacterium sp. TaxID=1168540 RepID=UPI0025E88D0F
EAWAVFAGDEAGDTIFTQTFYTLPTVADQDALLTKYAALRAIRDDVTKQLEDVRMAGNIGSSLQAEIDFKASGEKFDLLTSLDDDLKFVLITSAARVAKVASAEEESVTVTPSTHEKCERCWHYRPEVGSHPEHPGLCGRCVDNLFGKGEARRFA